MLNNEIWSTQSLNSFVETLQIGGVIIYVCSLVILLTVVVPKEYRRLEEVKIIHLFDLVGMMVIAPFISGDIMFGKLSKLLSKFSDLTIYRKKN